MITKSEDKNPKKENIRDFVNYIIQEVDEFVLGDYELVKQEFFSKRNCPAVTIKCNLLYFNKSAIKGFDECSHIQILMNKKEKKMAITPCKVDDLESLQWSRVNKHGITVSRTIGGQLFTALLFNDMNWKTEGTMKMLGRMQKNRHGDKIFVFNLIDAEAYFSLSEPSDDDPKRRKRVAFYPIRWQTDYGQPYEESKKPIVSTFDEMDGYLQIRIPQLSSKKSITKTSDTGTISPNLFNSNENVNKEETEDGTI